MRTRVSALLLSLAAGFTAAELEAAEARVRVRGSARIEATTVPVEHRTELSGAVTDDTGRPVPTAKVQLQWAGTSGGALILPPQEPCANGRSAAELPGYAGPAAEVTLLTDEWGRFCVRFAQELSEGRLLFDYVDQRGLLDGGRLALDLTPATAIDLRFAPAPETLSADREHITVQLEARVRSGRQPPGAGSLLVSFLGSDVPPVVLGRQQVAPGELVRFSFPTQALSSPGVGELRAVFASGTETAEARARVVVTSTVRLVSSAALETDADGVAALEVRVAAQIGKVGSGSVEARSQGRTVGIAPVTVAGETHIPLNLGPGARRLELELRYLPAAPWWIAGPEQRVAVDVPAANPLRRLPWALALAALTLWIGLSWRRPRRAARVAPRPSSSPVAKPAVTWKEPAPGMDGWSGRIVDAHDQAAIAGAQVQFLVAGEWLEVLSNDDGMFRLGARPTSGGELLRVAARWHATLERPLPPQGELVVALLTRRRALLARLVELTAGFRARVEGGEPTPDEVARQAADRARADVAVWARAVEGAVYGPDPVDADREAAVAALEPRQG